MNIINIIPIGNMPSSAYQEQVLAKAQTEAELLFNKLLEEKITTAAKKENIIINDFEDFVTTRLTKIEVAGTETTIIAMDVIIDTGSGDITDYGVKLVEWQGTGYNVTMHEPTTNINI